MRFMTTVKPFCDTALLRSFCQRLHAVLGSLFVMRVAVNSGSCMECQLPPLAVPEDSRVERQTQANCDKEQAKYCTLTLTFAVKLPKKGQEVL